MSDSPFKMLGVTEGASSDEIKKAYFELARKCHPDAYDGPDANQRFQEITNAYALLMDEDLRQSFEAQSGIYQNGETSSKDLFDRVFRDKRFRNPNLALEERALFAVMELKNGNEGPARDFVVDYRLPPQYFLPKRNQLGSETGNNDLADSQDHTKNSISDFFSKSPISGGG